MRYGAKVKQVNAGVRAFQIHIQIKVYCNIDEIWSRSKTGQFWDASLFTVWNFDGFHCIPVDFNGFRRISMGFDRFRWSPEPSRAEQPAAAASRRFSRRERHAPQTSLSVTTTPQVPLRCPCNAATIGTSTRPSTPPR